MLMISTETGRLRHRRCKRQGRVILIFIAALFLGLMAIPPAESLAYTVQKFDEPVTGMFAISPTSIDISAAPGEEVFRDITIANRTGQSLSVDLSTEDFGGSGDPAIPTILLGDENSPVGAKRWLEPEVANVAINHGESITLRIRISVPGDAEPGGHYAALLASFSSTAGPEETGVRVVSRVGCFFLIRVAGAVNEQGSLSRPEVPGFSTAYPITIGVIFNNQGNIHLKPSGRLLIKNLLGMTVAEIPVGEWTVLPDASRRTEITWDPRLPFGRYTAEAQINYGSDSIGLTASSSFWVTPWKVLLPAIIFLTGLAALIFIWIRRRRSYYYAEPAAASTGEFVAEETGPTGGYPPAQEEPKKGEARYVALDRLFPSMEDSRLIDVNDAETRELIHTLIINELDLSRNLISEGRNDEARKTLKEIRSAALRSGFLSEVVFIDDLLVSL